jgi:cyclophilin family peptidyl-prolyl cis-trans isomerase
MKKFLLSALCSFFCLPIFATGQEASTNAPSTTLSRKNPMIAMTTPHGTVQIELFADVAPKHVERILTLTREGFYDGILFHRVVPDFVVQAGDPKTKQGLNQPGIGRGTSNYPNVPLEVKEGVKNVRGALAAARTSDPNSFNSQFYIVLRDAPFLDMQYTVFGKVTGDGMSVVDKIQVGDPILKMTVVE